VWISSLCVCARVLFYISRLTPSWGLRQKNWRCSQTVCIQRGIEHTHTGNWSESGFGSLRGAPLNVSRCLGGGGRRRDPMAALRAGPPPPVWRWGWAFTRYCFTLKVYCGSESSFHCPPPSCKAYPIAMLLHDYCTIYNPRTSPLVYAIHHAILAIAISCKGQAGATAPNVGQRRGIYRSAPSMIMSPSSSINSNLTKYSHIGAKPGFIYSANRNTIWWWWWWWWGGGGGGGFR